MLELSRSAVVQAVVLVSFVLIASAVAWYALQKYRDRIGGDDTPSDQLTFFRKMRQRGELSETEFRSIKSELDGQPRGRAKTNERRE